MKGFSFGLGVLCFIYAGLYFLGLLPVGFWQSTIDLVMGRESGAYYKIVPTESFEYQGVVALSLGVVFVVCHGGSFKGVKLMSDFCERASHNKRRQSDQICAPASLQFACCAGRYSPKLSTYHVRFYR